PSGATSARTPRDSSSSRSDSAASALSSTISTQSDSGPMAAPPLSRLGRSLDEGGPRRTAPSAHQALAAAREGGGLAERARQDSRGARPGGVRQGVTGAPLHPVSPRPLEPPWPFACGCLGVLVGLLAGPARASARRFRCSTAVGKRR